MSGEVIRIQQIIFPEDERENYKLYYSGTGYERTDSGLYITEGGRVELFTYFNGFFVKQWRQYTQIRNPFGELQVQGNCRVSLLYKDRNGNMVTEENAEAHGVKKPETLRLEMQSWKEAEVYWIRVESPEDGAWLRDFSIYAEVEAVREVNCAAVICTCRREKDVTANIDQIRKLSGEQRPEVFIIDNGNTLQDHVFPEFVSCIPNKNCGGAGGFTRGMLEVVKRKKFTHVILMDDDISLEPGVLERTRSFLSVLKEEYEDAQLAGSLLRKDIPWEQFECGADWNRGRIKAYGKGFDLRDRNTLLENTEENSPEYGGWWYCCIPVKEILKKGYPLPLFIHRDDIEYGLRMGKTITMNGIGVWHEAVTKKLSQAGEYYDIRNMAIVNAAHLSDFTAAEWKKFLVKWTLGNILRGRYQYIRLNFLAVQDFLKGESWLAEGDGAELNEKVRKLLPELEEVEKKTEKVFPVPADISVYTAAVRKKVIYQDPSGKCLRTDKTFRETVQALAGLMHILRVVDRDFANAGISYRTKWKELTSENFWNGYLECEENE